MKKITLVVCAFIASIGLMKAQEVQLPAAYYNNNAPASVQEMAFQSEEGSSQRNLNVNIPFTGTYGADGTSSSSRAAVMVYDNGPYFNVTGTPDLSVLESVTLGMGIYGPSAAYASGNSVADEVVLAEAYDIEFIDVFAYQTGELAPTVNGVYVQIWSGDPSAAGSVIWGDLTTNIIDGAIYSGANRVLESDQAATNRQINRVTASTMGLTLPAGTYWVEYSLEGSGPSGPWAAPVAILGQATTGNAIQHTSTGWAPLEDSGSLTPYGVAFVMYGAAALSVKDNALAGFNFYPNPTSDVLNLSANNNIESVSLFNLLGQKVMTVNVEATTSNISLAGLATGTYVMKVTVDGQTGTYKVTKK